ncbi:RNA polymerase sigma factor [Pararobbsia silviterrae]|uniref:RNA polymerase sigma factor n=1 Tax=Pararobbsia silviterrae TaxID=1792498 RepID=A0A494XYM8_9BURK|nr:RNA polymerase sigma factor [Pararobbsia silviterrae]RKP55695.1 RNA polymerase sigma factor [Pararobbsia silviterrae]
MTGRLRREEREVTNDDRRNRFERVVLPHLDAAYNLARWLTGSASDADDVVQDAFMRAFRFFETFDGDNARAWLLAIVRNTWFTEWRRRRAHPGDVEFDEASFGDEAMPGWDAHAHEDPEAISIRRDALRLVQRALDALAVEYREVIVLRELEDMSYRDIAAVTGMPVGTVMSRLSRGRRMLCEAVRALQQGSGDGGHVRLVRPAGDRDQETTHHG